MRQTLKKYELLNSKTEISDLFKNNRSIFVYPFKVLFVPNNSQHFKLLITVPKKNFKHAVSRNLLKRRIKEAYRKNKYKLYESDVPPQNIAFIYLAKEPLKYDKIEQKINVILRQLSNEIHKK